MVLASRRPRTVLGCLVGRAGRSAIAVFGRRGGCRWAWRGLPLLVVCLAMGAPVYDLNVRSMASPAAVLPTAYTMRASGPPHGSGLAAQFAVPGLGIYPFVWGPAG